MVRFIPWDQSQRLTKSRVAVVFAIQSWLAETSEQRKTAATPAYFSVGMSCELASRAKQAVEANRVSYVLACVLYASIPTTASNPSSWRLRH
jgi:hypothetical protein